MKAGRVLVLSLGDGAAGVVAGAGEEALRRSEEGGEEVIASADGSDDGLREVYGVDGDAGGYMLGALFFGALMMVSNGSCACDSKPGRSSLLPSVSLARRSRGAVRSLFLHFTASRTPFHRTSHFAMDEAFS